MIAHNRKDLRGMVFGRYSVIKFARTHLKRTYWSCQCSCGTIKEVRGSHLLRGAIVSCGCYGAEQAQKRRITHGMSKTKTYKVWAEIISRCHNPNSTVYSHYGGRGITMCGSWRHSFENFLADMGELPFVGAEIDRIDNDGNYDPNNCRWSTHKENVNNRSTSLHYEYKGVTKTLMEWSEVLGVKYKTLHRRIRVAKMSTDDAFTFVRSRKGRFQ